MAKKYNRVHSELIITGSTQAAATFEVVLNSDIRVVAITRTALYQAQDQEDLEESLSRKADWAQRHGNLTLECRLRERALRALWQSQDCYEEWESLLESTRDLLQGGTIDVAEITKAKAKGLLEEIKKSIIEGVAAKLALVEGNFDQELQKGVSTAYFNIKYAPQGTFEENLKRLLLNGLKKLKGGRGRSKLNAQYKNFLKSDK